MQYECTLKRWTQQSEPDGEWEEDNSRLVVVS